MANEIIKGEVPVKFAVKTFLVTEDDAKQRIDKFLYSFFNKKIPMTFIYGLIRTGQVRVNSKRVKINYNLYFNDKIRIPPVKCNYKINEKDSRSNNLLKNKEKYLTIWKEKIKNAIVLETPYLLIINKPVNLAVHGGSKIKIGLLEVLKSLKPKEHFLELVHRLDKDTSGCIMIAKKRSYLKKLHLLLQQHKVIKTYEVLVLGNFSEKKVVELPLKKIIKNSKEHFVKLSESGSYAKTEFYPVKQFFNKKMNFSSSFIIAKPLTGRTHQIRVHLASIGFPIANDDKYGNWEYNNNIKKLGLNRMLLHAKSLEFICPESNQVIFANAELDKKSADFLFKKSKLGDLL